MPALPTPTLKPRLLLVPSCALPTLQCWEQQWKVSKWDSSLPWDLYEAQAKLRREVLASRRASAAA